MSDAPLTPFWQQPSHPNIQEVIFSPNGFTSKSISRVDLAPFAIFAKFSFPPCTQAVEPTYATVQYGRNLHLNLNSDLVYINHSCEPSLLFDTGNMVILAGPKGLKKDQELTFFYPSTEWAMAQGFDCFCGTGSCKGRISGASQMTSQQLEGMWLNQYIRDMVEERDVSAANGIDTSSTSTTADPVKEHLQKVLAQARYNAGLAQESLRIYSSGKGAHDAAGNGRLDLINGSKQASKAAGRNGVSSRELSGEMGGDTLAVK